MSLSPQLPAKNQVGPPEKIAIVGKACSFALAPYDDDSWEIWTISDLVPAGQAKRSTRHFELHPADWFDEAEAQKVYWEWLQAVTDIPIYLQKLDPRIPAGILYPKGEIVQQFGCYFTNSISWMIAYAIACKPTHLSLFGVDMAQVKQDGNAEYERQRPSCEYFLGWAAGAGIKTYVPPESDLLKCRRLYGFETDINGMYKKCMARRQELAQRIANCDAKAHQFMQNSAHLQGALDAMNWSEQFLLD